MAIKISKYYQKKRSDGTFDDKIYFSTYANLIDVKRAGSTNYESLQDYLDELTDKITNKVTWNIFSEE